MPIISGEETNEGSRLSFLAPIGSSDPNKPLKRMPRIKVTLLVKTTSHKP